MENLTTLKMHVILTRMYNIVGVGDATFLSVDMVFNT